MNSAKNAMLATSMIAMAASAVLVEALSPVEHDRVMHYPDTDSAIFELPQGAFAALEKLGAVKRVDVVDTAAVLAASTQASTGPVETITDVVDISLLHGTALVDADGVLEQLDQALAKNDGLANELTASQERVLELEALLATKAEEAAASASALADASVVEKASSADPEAATATKPAGKGSKAAKA